MNAKNKNIYLSLLLFVSVSLSQISFGQMTFVHPGGNHNKQDLDFVKGKIAEGAEPWTSKFNQVRNLATAGTNNTAPTTENGQKQDGRKAYANALAWYYTDNDAYAENAIGILNTWGTTFNGYPSTAGQDLLQGGWIGALLGPAAEIMRGYDGWAANDMATVQQMFKDEFYPVINTMSTWNGNVDLTQIDAMLNIAVFCEDETEFNLGIQRLNARNPRYFYIAADGQYPNNAGEWFAPNTTWIDGLTQESCRDYGHHAQYAMASALHGAEVAWNQGVDVYGQNQERYIAVLELMAKQLLTGSMQNACSVSDIAASDDLYDTWEVGFNHYHNRMGLELPQTEEIITTKIRSQGASDWNIFFETLTHGSVSSLYAACSKPELGENLSICGQNTLTLNANIPATDRTIKWYKNDALVPNANGSSLVINEVGTYKVTVDSAGCETNDVVNIIGAFPVDLGKDLELCKSTEFVLDAGNENGNAANYTWNTGETTQTIVANKAGTYIVNVTVPNCGSVIDTLVISTKLLPVSNTIFCSTGVTDLRVNTTGTFEWFDAPDASTPIHTGRTMETLVTENTTYYVQDAGGISASFGKAAVGTGETWAVGVDDFPSEDKINNIIVSKAITLNSIAVYVRAGGTNVTINLVQNGKVIHTATKTGLGSGKQTIELDFGIEPGNYEINAVGTTGELTFEASGATYPYTYGDFISFTYIMDWQAAWYGIFYDWKITAGNICSKTPVEVVIDANNPNCEITGVGTLSSHEINIFPNPAHDVLNIELNVELNNDLIIEIKNSLGVTVASTVAKSSNSIDINLLPKGVYYLTVGGFSQSVIIE